MKEQKPKDNFNKKEGTFLYDNKKDEVVMNVLELYPNAETHFFKGANGAKKKDLLQKKLRSVFNEMEQEEYANALGDKFRKFKDKAREKLRGVGKVVARAALVVPRGAAIALIRLNFRGAATRFSLLTSDGVKKIEKRWRNLGGKSDKLRDAINAGKNKPLIVCGKKCRSKAGKNPSISNAIKDDFVNSTGVDIAGLVASGGGVVMGLVSLVSGQQNFKNQQDLMLLEAELAKKAASEKKIDDSMSPQEKALAEEIIKAQEKNYDPISAIENNPNLTADEKAAAIEEIQKSQNLGNANTKKIVAGGIILLGLLGILYFSLKNKSES
jgi:hypothetical protein